MRWADLLRSQSSAHCWARGQGTEYVRSRILPGLPICCGGRVCDGKNLRETKGTRLQARAQAALACRTKRTRERRPDRASAMPSFCFCSSFTLVTCAK